MGPGDAAIQENPAIPGLRARQPGQADFCSGGVGSPQHLAGSMLNHVAGVGIVRIPYKGKSLASHWPCPASRSTG
jgi:tripartite-type tricarboxylate transporter receptor subunit TctC